MIYINKNITIIGLGKTGFSCINFFIKKKANITVMDTRSNISNINLLPDNINIFLGKLDINYILMSDLIVLSPGISIYTYEINEAINKGIEVVSDIEIFFRENIETNVIAITGTDGKSTVSTLIYNIIKDYNYSVCLAGNIGYPILDTLYKKSYQFYVIEISSFQLETTYSLKTIASTLINISEDHLDRHKNIFNYRNLKLKIFDNSDYCVINYEDKFCWPDKIYNNVKYNFFGFKNCIYNLKNINNNFYIFYKNEKIIDCSKLKIFGLHNYLNIICSLTILEYLDINIHSKINTINNFVSLNHRLNIIYEKNNTKWINDSKSTNIHSLCAAINSINFFKYKFIHLILGGIIKSLDFSYLQKIIYNKNIKIYCFGKDGKYINSLFYDISIYLYDLESIFKILCNNVKDNEIVLFSPGCSSLDQYTNYEDRGNNFIYLVNKYIK